MLAIGAIIAGDDDFAHLFAVRLLTSLDDVAIRRALRFIHARDGGDHIIARLSQRLRRHAGAPHRAALAELDQGRPRRAVA